MLAKILTKHVQHVAVRFVLAGIGHVINRRNKRAAKHQPPDTVGDGPFETPVLRMRHPMSKLLASCAFR